MVKSVAWKRRLALVVAASVLGGVPLPAAAGGSALEPGGPSLFSAPLATPLRALKVATLDLPQPVGTDAPPVSAALTAPTATPAAAPASATASSATASDETPTASAPEARRTSLADAAFQFPPALVLTRSPEGEAPAIPSAPEETVSTLEIAFDILLELPVIADDDADLAATYGALAAQFHGTLAPLPVLPGDDGAPAGPDDLATAPEETVPQTPLGRPLYHDTVAVFGSDPNVFPPLAFEYQGLEKQGLVPSPLARPQEAPALAPAVDASADEAQHEPDGIWPSPAQRLGLSGDKLAKARKCLAEAIYFESRGEPKRGQIAVAQVVVNRVFSGYYPADVCGTVYQNANRHLACQFTFACDNVKDVIREPDMWVQAKEISAEMLDGKLWLEGVGRATHYHAYWVHPRWVREMQKLDRIGVHTFYRPRRWKS